MWLVMAVKEDAVKNNIAKEPGMLGPDQTWDGKSECRHLRNQWTKME